MRPTPKHLEVLRHMLGISETTGRRYYPYRNYAAVDPNDETYLELAVLGLVEKYKDAVDWMPYDLYRCTKRGKAEALASVEHIKVSRGRQRYLSFCR